MFGHIIIARSHQNTNGHRDLKLTFTNRKVYYDAKHELRRAGYVIKDAFFGYTVTKDADAALKMASQFFHAELEAEARSLLAVADRIELGRNV